MIFGLQLSLLWLLAWGALAFFGLSVVWLLISAAWQFSKRESEIINDELNQWNNGGSDAPLEIPPKKETAWMYVAKSMMFLALILGAYDLGTKVNYSKEYAAWKAGLPNYMKAISQYQQDYAAWKARAAKENK